MIALAFAGPGCRMSDESSQSQMVRDLFARARGGDRAAREELFRNVRQRLEHLACKMLKHFPKVQSLADADDLVHNAVVSLLRALEQEVPASAQDFFHLAAVHLRRALLDLARKARSPSGKPPERLAAADGDSDDQGCRPLDPGEAPEEMDYWYSFHLSVERLEAEQREVVGLIYYHGWKQNDVAELLHVSKRTVARLWKAALSKIEADLKR
jgi:RNA polymerase sigma factor (sigma-70 family)